MAYKVPRKIRVLENIRNGCIEWTGSIPECCTVFLIIWSDQPEEFNSISRTKWFSISCKFLCLHLSSHPRRYFLMLMLNIRSPERCWLGVPVFYLHIVFPYIVFPYCVPILSSYLAFPFCVHILRSLVCLCSFFVSCPVFPYCVLKLCSHIVFPSCAHILCSHCTSRSILCFRNCYHMYIIIFQAFIQVVFTLCS